MRSPRRSTILFCIERALGFIVLLFVLTTAALPQTAPQPVQSAGEAIPPGTEITVATRVIAPFVMQEGAELSGFSIDLWRAIGAELGIKSRFVTYDMLRPLLDAVRDGRNDAGIAAISITAKRGETLDFSQPMFRSGLSIMVPANSQKLNVMGMILSSGMLKAIGIFLLVLIIPAHVIWLLARGRDDGLPISESYLPGISTPSSGPLNPWAARRRRIRRGSLPGWPPSSGSMPASC